MSEDTTKLAEQSANRARDNNELPPFMTDEFARVYEMTANRITGQIAAAALDRASSIGWGSHVIDIGAGAGAGSLSVPAALRGASVMAIDNAPGMVNLLVERLAPYSTSAAQLMDGQALALADGVFDASFSIIGASIFPDWRSGLAEQARVTRPGGSVFVATWKNVIGGGPFVIMAQALRATLPQAVPPVPPAGFVALADPRLLHSELEAVGVAPVHVEEIEVVWEGRAGASYLEDLHDLHRFMPAYRGLHDDDRSRVDEAILDALTKYTSGERVVLRTPVLWQLELDTDLVGQWLRSM